MLDGTIIGLLADALETTGDCRVLRRLDLDRRLRPSDDDTGLHVGVVVDCETTSLDTARCNVVELSLRRVRYDQSGRITTLDPPLSWLEDPGESLDPRVAALTGLSDDDLRGRSIDDREACAVIASANVIIGFNSAFDRPIIERRLPAIAGLPWACAMTEVDWRARGFDGSGRSLAWLLAQAGWFHGAHRAGADVDATIALLEHRSVDGVTALAELLATASRPGWLFRALGASFSVKDSLRARGYRWDPDDKLWSREVGEADRHAEATWLAEHVYAPQHMSRADGPVVREVTWEIRHGR